MFEACPIVRFADGSWIKVNFTFSFAGGQMRGTLGRRRRRHFLQGAFLWRETKAPMMDSTQPLNHTFHEMNIAVEMCGY